MFLLTGSTWMFRNWFEYCGCCIFMPTIGFIFIWSFACISEWIQRKAVTCCECNLGICLYQMFQWTAPSLTNTHIHSYNMQSHSCISLKPISMKLYSYREKNIINCGTQRTNPHQHRGIVIINSLKFIQLDHFAFCNKCGHV